MGARSTVAVGPPLKGGVYSATPVRYVAPRSNATEKDGMLHLLHLQVKTEQSRDFIPAAIGGPLGFGGKGKRGARSYRRITRFKRLDCPVAPCCVSAYPLLRIVFILRPIKLSGIYITYNLQ